jgi:hypothetical protein
MRTTLITAAVATAALATALAATVPADAAGGGLHAKKGIAPPPTDYKVIANGLNNPRQLNFSSEGRLYVAEAGAGGGADCTLGGEGSTVCWGASGSVTVIANGHQRRVITGLPSYADQGSGASALGPADVVPYGRNKLAVSIGFGLDPAQRDGLASPGQLFGRVLRFDPLGPWARSTLGDLTAFEGAHNPIHDPNSDPTGLAKKGSTFYAVDSGGNDMVSIHHGRSKLAAVFHDVATDQGDVQAVPTDVVVGPDGALYISELTGFPFVKGAATIYRMVPGHKARVYATGLTNVTSLAFAKNGTLYAVQIANDGLLNGPTGALWKIRSKASGKKSKKVSTDQFAPYGVAIKGKTAYVSINSVVPGGGQVVKIPLG